MITVLTRHLHHPVFIFSDGEVPPVSYSTDIPGGALAGLAVTTGIVEGRARVVESLEDAHIEKGDILVTKFTDPSWTPVFVSLSGLPGDSQNVLRFFYPSAPTGKSAHLH